MLFYLDEKDPRPIYQQLVNQLKEQLSTGIVRPGDELPSVRELSESLGINLHTVRAAYLKLREEGIIDMRLGRKAKIARRSAERPSINDVPDVVTRFRETIADAMARGLSLDDIRQLVNAQLSHLSGKRGEENDEK